MTTKTKPTEADLLELEEKHSKRRAELLREKAGYRKEHRLLADGAHDMRKELERVDEELRELEKDEMKVAAADAG